MKYSTISVSPMSPDVVEAIAGATKKASRVISDILGHKGQDKEQLLGVTWNEDGPAITETEEQAVTDAKEAVVEKKAALDTLKGEQTALETVLTDASSALSEADGAQTKAQGVMDAEEANGADDQVDVAARQVALEGAQETFTAATAAVKAAKAAVTKGTAAVKKAEGAHKAAVKEVTATEKILADAKTPAKVPKEVNWENVSTLADRLTTASSGLSEAQTAKDKKVNEMLTTAIKTSKAIYGEYVNEKRKIDNSWKESDAAKHFKQVEVLETEITSLKSTLEGKEGTAEVEIEQKINMKEKEVESLKGLTSFGNLYGYFPGSTSYRTSAHEKHRTTHESEFKLFEAAYNLAAKRVSGLTNVVNILGALDDLRVDAALCRDLKECTTKAGKSVEAIDQCYDKVQKLITAVGKATDFVVDADGQKVEPTTDPEWLTNQLESSLTNFAEKHEKVSGICSFG